MSYEISGVGKYNYVPTTLLSVNHNLKQHFSQALFSHNAERLLLRKSQCNTLYLAGATTSPEDLLFTLNESMEFGGINLPQVIPVGDGIHNVFGYIRLPGIYPPTYVEDEFGLFYEMEINDFPMLKKRGITSVIIDQFTNVFTFEESGRTTYIKPSQIKIPSYTKQRIFLPDIISRVVLQDEDEVTKVKLHQHHTRLTRVTFL